MPGRLRTAWSHITHLLKDSKDDFIFFLALYFTFEIFSEHTMLIFVPSNMNYWTTYKSSSPKMSANYRHYDKNWFSE